jgi:F-type H+-transporting ATPase subunit epsilon
MLKVAVLSLEKTVLETEAAEVILPTTAGPLGVFTNHQPMVAQLIPGTIQLKNGNKTEEVATLGGFVEILDNQVSIMNDTAELAATPDEAKLQEAIDRAERARQEAKGSGERQAASAFLASSLSKIKGVKRKKRA